MNIKKYLNTKTIFISNNSFNDLKIKDHITILDNLSANELDNLEYLKDNMAITIKANYITKNGELTYYNNIKKIIEKLKKYRKTYSLNITVNNRETFRQSSLLDSIPNNIQLTISNSDNQYTLEEYMDQEIKLENLVKPIRDANLSPLEKYLAVYDIVKNFKPYKENKEDKRQSRDLRYILKDDNEYIVCVGFARLLSELLNRVEIPCKFIHVDVDDSYEEGSENEIKNINHVGHARNLIRIDDDKYNIHGIYLSDTTFDSKRTQNTFLHSLLTFDRLKEAKKLEKLNDLDLLMDFHNLDDFKKKLEYYLKKENKILKDSDDTSLDLTRRIYKNLYLKIMDILIIIDEQFFIKMYNKYNNDLCDNIKDVDLLLLNEIISYFTTEYYKYIMPLTNNKIELNTILNAAAVAKRRIYKMNNEEFTIWFRKLIDDCYSANDTMFPYIYDPNNDKEAYLENRNTKK